jgi:Ca2+-binding EF-hand superfamily protein
MRSPVLGVCLVCLIAAGCGGGPPDGPPRRHVEEWHAPVQMLLRYVGPDGNLTRAQLEAGLHKDFEAADANHNGTLEPDEMRAVNQQRWKEDQSAVSPLVDWNGDGVIDFSEFAATARTLFKEVDQDHNGVLTTDEMRAARGLGPETGPGSEKGNQQGAPDGRPGGGQGGGRGGPPGRGPGG